MKEEAESDIEELEVHSTELQREHTHLQKEWDDATLEVRKLQDQVAASEGRTYPSSPLGISLRQARHSLAQLTEARAAKQAEIDAATKAINAIKREEPGRLRRQALEACLPALFQFIDGTCAAARHESTYQEFDGHVEHPIPWELTLAGGVGIEVETMISKWLSALKREGILIPGEPSDNARHLPPPTSYYVRIETDGNFAAHAARCGAGNTAAIAARAHWTGIVKGFRFGRNY